ncbi:hypothetical protein ACEN9X_20355 [Mucilaginibacter sp. Mucisp86]|uniref:hypothetical protein n=1 Tax=Mucilaginibacter sp. Mucisp86 TaxID=3243060 RepID=UPI0039B4FE65
MATIRECILKHHKKEDGKVHIRKRKLTNGRKPLMVDFSPPLRNPENGKSMRFEFLGLSL